MTPKQGLRTGITLALVVGVSLLIVLFLEHGLKSSSHALPGWAGLTLAIILLVALGAFVLLVPYVTAKLWPTSKTKHEHPKTQASKAHDDHHKKDDNHSKDGHGHDHGDHHGHHGPGILTKSLIVLGVVVLLGLPLWFFILKPMSEARPMTRDAWHMPRGPLMARTTDDTSPLTYTCKGKGQVTAVIQPGTDIFLWLDNQKTMKIMPDNPQLVISAADNASMSTSNGGTMAVSTQLYRVQNTRTAGSEPFYLSCCYQSADYTGSCMRD